jgi:hypothetical protein
LLLAQDLGYIDPSQYEPLAAETRNITNLLAAFIIRLRQPNSRKLIADSR